MRFLATALLAVLATGLLSAFGCKSTGPALANPAANPHPAVFNPLPGRAVVRKLQVQMAYNLDDGVVYGHLSWEGDRQTTGRYWRFEGGEWRLRGGGARDARRKSDPISAEAQLTIAWGARAGLGAFPNFDRAGCMLACHDGGGYMPEWSESGSSTPASMRLPDTPFYAGLGLDFWRWQAQSSNGLGYWSDEFLDDTQPPAGDALQRDPGTGGAGINALVDGNPSFMFDPATTDSGGFTVPFAQLAGTQDFAVIDPASPSPVAGLTTPLGLDWSSATAAGYAPQEGDTVPYALLAAPTLARDDILAVLSPDGGATVFDRSHYDDDAGRWHVYFSRDLNTVSGTDLPIAPDDQHVLAFALHLDETSGRDHYVSFPYKFWFEDPTSPFGPPFDTDSLVRQITGAGSVPDFSDTGFYLVFEIDLFLPGLTSWEFLTDTRTSAFQFGGPHGGALELQSGLNGPLFIGCRDCHVVDKDDPIAPFVVGGPLELRTPRRGGMFEATPVSLRTTVLPALAARCGSCHAPGGVADEVPFAGVSAARIFQELSAPGRVRWVNPLASPVLKLPSTNSDKNHPPTASLSGFLESEDYFRILYWILFDGPDN